MKRIKSCSTLRIKAHQLLNEEEREIFKYAIRNYRKNQSIDILCEIIAKIITDSNRSCLVSLVADMLKEEQKSQFLHRCYTRFPSCNISQHYLASSPEFQVNTNKNFKSSNLSLRAATFVSKNRLNQSKSHFNLDKVTFDNPSASTLKMNNDIFRHKLSETSNNKSALKHSDSEELLKTIERCSIKVRPTLSNLKDKGFWYANNDSTTDDDSNRSYSSLADKDQMHNKQLEIAEVTASPQLYSGLRTSKTTIFNGTNDKFDRNYLNQTHQKEKSKLMIFKLHFSSVNIIEECLESVENLSESEHSTVVSLLHSNSFDNIFMEYHLPMFTELSPSISEMSSINLKPKLLENKTIIQNCFKTQNQNYQNYQNYQFSFNENFIKQNIIQKNLNNIIKNKKILIDQECQTPFVITCDSSTQTFLA